MTEAFIVGGARTPMTEYVGALKDVSALDLGAVAARGALQKSGLAAEAVDDVVFGNVLQTSGDALYGARHIALKAGVPIGVPALTVNRLCGSGLQAAITGAQQIRLGEAHVVLAGGTESLSQAPHVIRGLRGGLKLGQGRLEDTLYECLLDTMCGLYMAQTAEKCAAQYGISREEQDRYAVESQQKAGRAYDANRFANEIIPVSVAGRKGDVVVDMDEHPRFDASLDSMAKLPPVFRKQGSVHAGNSSGVTDGASSMLVASGEAVARHNLTPMARIVGYAQAGVDPKVMGIGPVPATRRLLDETGLSLDAIDLIELNEAFAAQVIACDRELHLDHTRLNVHGGAISLGHPIGATGARITTTLLHALVAHEKRYGLATLCISGGMGLSMLVERS
jgi:acetyl-CoA acetyltransferase family protein